MIELLLYVTVMLLAVTNLAQAIQIRRLQQNQLRHLKITNKVIDVVGLHGAELEQLG